MAHAIKMKHALHRASLFPASPLSIRRQDPRRILIIRMYNVRLRPGQTGNLAMVVRYIHVVRHGLHRGNRPAIIES